MAEYDDDGTVHLSAEEFDALCALGRAYNEAPDINDKVEVFAQLIHLLGSELVAQQMIADYLRTENVPQTIIDVCLNRLRLACPVPMIEH